jgi:hypothetical protein
VAYATTLLLNTSSDFESVMIKKSCSCYDLAIRMCVAVRVGRKTLIYLVHACAEAGRPNIEHGRVVFSENQFGDRLLLAGLTDRPDMPDDVKSPFRVEVFMQGAAMTAKCANWSHTDAGFLCPVGVYGSRWGLMSRSGLDGAWRNSDGDWLRTNRMDQRLNFVELLLMNEPRIPVIAGCGKSTVLPD